MKSNQSKKVMRPINEDLQSAMALPHIIDYTKRVKTSLEDLRKILRLWNVSKSFSINMPKEIQLLKEYIEAQHRYYEEDQFDQTFSLLEHFDLNLAFIEDMSLILKSFKLFPKAIWPIRFHSKFVSRISSISNPDELYYVFAQVYCLACGQFSTSRDSRAGLRPIHTKVIPMNRFFSVRILRERNLFLHIGVQKVPIIKNGLIKRYEFVQYLHFLDILGDQFVENKVKLDERMNYFTTQIYSDAAKKDHSDEFEIDRLAYIGTARSRSKNYFFKESYNDYTERYEYYECALEDNKTEIYHPVPFKSYYVSVTENSMVIFDKETKRWLSKDHLTFMERKKLIEFQKQISDSMVKRFVDFQSAKSLVELLTKIPNFKVSLTEQEKDVIGENGNVLAIGRSGTGKTTCAVLRLFSIEMLFKIRLSLSKKKFMSTLEGVRCGSDDIDSAVGLHCIFLTASPVLTHEIQRYYKKLTDNIKTELEKKKQRVQAEQKRRLQQEQMERKNRSVSDVSIGEESFDQLNATEEEIVEPPSHLAQSITENLEVPSSLPIRKSTEEIEEQREMQEEFEGIELNEDIKNEQFKEQQEEDIDELKNKFQESIKRFHSLFDLTESDYPGFFTVKSYIMMIDGTLLRPFFIRQKSVAAEEQSKASWHNERRGVMMIENYYRGQQEEKVQEVVEEEEFNYSDEEELQHEYLRQIQLRQNKQKQNLTKKLTKKAKNVLSFEVDYEYFIVHFWPRVVKKYYSSRNITPHLVWTEIYSTIKGSAEAHQYPGQYLTQKAYVDTSTNTFLTKDEKLDIYETFCQYQRWKIRSGGYDIMDAVNYILNVFRYRGYEGPEIHYIMIDEVQDLPHAMIYLLSKTATYGVFYSGDTAQTIAKGVGFRFCDLRSLFNNKIFGSSLQLKAPVMKHLTVNFRSHNNILQLANSVVSALQILFPKTIDRLKKEVSDLHGPKPMILASADEELLFYVLCGGQEKKQQGSGMKKPPLEFGCDQVIIVRDQESKSKVPAMLQHALCLTIYQAKGLQFNDVILFNFFEESPCPEKWFLLKNLHVATAEIPKDQYEKNLSRHNQPQPQPKPQQSKQQQLPKKEGAVVEEQGEEQVYAEETFNKKTNCYTVKKLINSNSKNFRDTNDYAELCSELKLLYTAITRPKKTLIIYDSGQAQARGCLERIWERLDVIEVITKQLVMESLNKKSENAVVSEEVKIFKTIVLSTDRDQWKQQGLKMYARGFFDQAMKCFDRSGHKELYHKAEANRYADEATRKLIEIQSERNTIKSGSSVSKDINRSELSKLKKKLKAEEADSLKKFLQAGRIFQEMQMFKQAGQCFFSGKSFDRAFQNFCKAFMHRQAGESLEMQNRYREAAEYYEKEDNYLKVIECLDMVNEWTLILEKIHQFANKMSDYEKQALLKKYSALALEELVYEIEFQNEEECAKPQNNRVEVIQEKQSDEEDEDDESQEGEEGEGEEEDQDDPEVAAQREYERRMSEELSSNPSRKQSQDPDALKPIDIKESVYEQLGQKPSPKQEQQEGDKSMSFSALNASQAPEEKEIPKDINSIDQSFGDLNRSQQPVVLQGLPSSSQKQDLQSIGSSFSQLNAKYQNELEPDLQSIRSLVDPQDLWVKNSISQINQKVQSEYSVMEDLEQGFSLNAKIIKTRGNIFVQDEIMRKIVNIVSIINSSVEKFFSQFKGYQSLITVSKADKGELVDSRPEISDFEEIDPEFINIILDTLQSFKLFKLCLFVCNRYHLPAKAGRYLISLGLKYSTNCISNNAVNPILLAPSAYRKIQLEKGILASIALHAIYQNVNAQFLKVKVTEEGEGNKHSLGTYFIEGLVLEGLYKKAVFMVDPQEGLRITQNYNDFEAFSNIYHQKILKRNHPELPAFPEDPTTSEDWTYTKMLLRKAILEYCIVHRFQTVSSRYYKQFELTEMDVTKRLAKFNIPHYLPFTKVLFTSIPDDLVANFKGLLSKGYAILTKGNNVQCMDFIAALQVVINSEEHLNKQAEIHGEQHPNYLAEISNDEFLELFRCLDYIKNVLRKLSGPNAMNILEAMLNTNQCYRIGYCRSMSFLSDTFTFVNRTSTIANDFVESPKSTTFAYFFEQDYNFILVKTARAVKAISRKFQEAVARLYRRRIHLEVNKRENFLFEDWVKYEEEMVIRKALSFEVQCLGDPKKRKKEAQAPTKKSKALKQGYDFRCKNRDQVVRLDDSSSSEEEEYVNREPQFYMSSCNPKMRYLSHAMHHWFNQQSINSKEIVQGRYLYGAGLNAAYREYTEKEGGFNLFDALEFQRFKRVDLFAENILTVYEQLTLFSKHNFLAEVLTLLLVQLKSIENPKGFALSVQTDSLRYFQQLKFMGAKQGNEKQVQSDDVSVLLSNNVECRFNYINRYVSEMNTEELSGLVCDFLGILQEEEASRVVSLPSVAVLYVLNMGKNDTVNEAMRKVIRQLGPFWKKDILHTLIDSKSVGDFQNKRRTLLTSSIKLNFQQPLHTISVSIAGDLDAAITDSEFDYEVESRILKGRARAVSKIAKWWRSKRVQLKDKRGAAANYFQWTFSPTNLPESTRLDILGDIRLMRVQHKGRILSEVELLSKTEKAKTELLSFYLSNTISSSLDFHFILMSLNRIDLCRRHFYQFCSEDVDELHEFDLEEIQQEMGDLLGTIEVWKADEKWLREKNVNLKKKKVFEVKWMTKNIGGFGGILKKRAGLKKQALLQDKRKYLKRNK